MSKHLQLKAGEALYLPVVHVNKAVLVEVMHLSLRFNWAVMAAGLARVCTQEGTSSGFAYYGKACIYSLLNVSEGIRITVPAVISTKPQAPCKLIVILA